MAAGPAPGATEQRRERLEAVLREIERRFGPGVVYRLQQARPAPTTPVISTGSLTIDHGLGLGGLPRGHLSEVAGPVSSGKRTLVAHLIANAQRDGGYAAYIDAAHACSADRLHRCGATLDDLLLAVPESAAEALTMIELLVLSGGLDLVVLDALPFGGHLISEGSRSLLLTRGWHRIARALRDAPQTAVVVLQEVPAFDTRAHTGSRALRAWTVVRLLLRPMAPLRQPSGLVSGLRVQAEVLANRYAPLGPAGTLEIDDHTGIRRAAELFDLACAAGLIVLHPLGWLAGDVLLGRSRAQAMARLDAEPNLSALLEEQLAHWLP